VPPTPSPYHRLNPLTKAVIATVGSVGAFAAGGYLGPIAIIVVMMLLASRAGVIARLVRVSLLLTTPIAVSVVLVSVFTRAGTNVLFSIGPFDATAEGVDFAAQTLVRLFAISLSIGLFVMTTDPRAFVFDLERRGVSPRIAFVAVATIEAVPALVERAGVIGESQRARGLDTEGSLRARLRGVLPLVGACDHRSSDRCGGAKPRSRVQGLQPAREAAPAVVDARHDLATRAPLGPARAARGDRRGPRHRPDLT